MPPSPRFPQPSQAGWLSAGGPLRPPPLGAHQEKLLQHPAMILPQGQLVGFDGVHADQIGVVLVLLPIAKALQQGLDEPESPGGGGGGEKLLRGCQCPPPLSWAPVRSSSHPSGAEAALRSPPHLFSHMRAKVAPTFGQADPCISFSASKMF